MDDVTLEDLHLYNSYDGIIVGNCGRLKAERISGQPLHIGMQFDQVHDTIYVNDIHFWPFWALTPGAGLPAVVPEQRCRDQLPRRG